LRIEGTGALLEKERTKMRKLLTTAAAALALSAMGLAAPAFADEDRDGRGPRGSYDQGYQHQGEQPGDRGYRDRDHGDDRDYDRRGFDFDRHERSLDAWERGWRRDGQRWQGRHGVLPYRLLVRRLAQQGYYSVRGLKPGRFGFGWRAFAFTGRGHPVMLRINPYTGRVLDVRYVGR
jgi:hypothetical protein